MTGPRFSRWFDARWSASAADAEATAVPPPQGAAAEEASPGHPTGPATPSDFQLWEREMSEFRHPSNRWI